MGYLPATQFVTASEMFELWSYKLALFRTEILIPTGTSYTQGSHATENPVFGANQVDRFEGENVIYMMTHLDQ